MRKHYTAAQRGALTSLVVSGQATPRSAAAQLGVPESTAYYWLRGAGPRATALARVPNRASTRASRRPPRLRDAPQVFARLVRGMEGPSLITLRVGGATLEIRSGFDPALLRDVIAILVETGP